MRVVVLGGTRFIGRAILADLVGAGHEVLVVHRGRSEPDDLPPVEHRHLDRRDTAALREALASFRPDALVDTMAMTRADAETAVEALPGDIRLVVLSSMDVYRAFGAVNAGGETDPLPLDETSPVRTERYPYRGKIPGMDDYEKLDVEAVFLRRQGTVFRLPMVYGEHDGQRREEPILRRVRAGRTRVPVGPGTWLWSRGYVGDIATAVRLAIETPGAIGEVLNLCEAQTWSMAAWLCQILAATSAPAELTRVPEDVLPRDLALTGSVHQHVLVSPARARTLLGWTHGDPEDRVRRSVRWHIAHPPSEPDMDFSADDTALAAADAG